MIAWALRHRILMVVITVAAFVVALGFPFLGLIGSAFFPQTDDSQFSVRVRTEASSSLDYTISKTRQISRLARAMDEVQYTYTTIGGQTGNVSEGSVFVQLEPKAERNRDETAVSSDLRRELSRLLGMQESSIAAGGMNEQKPIQLRLTGDDVDRLTELAEKVAAEVRKVESATDVGLSTSGRKPELEVNVQRGLASRLGISVSDIATTLRPAFAGIDVGD